MFGRLKQITKTKKWEERIAPCFLELPNTGNKNIVQEVYTLNTQFGDEIYITGIRDRDNQKNWFTGMETMYFSRDSLVKELSILARHEYLIGTKTLGGGGSGAIDCLFYELKRDYRDSPILITSNLFTELPNVRAQLNSIISHYVSLKLRGRGALWLFSNSELIRDSGGTFSSANKNIANLVWCLAHANNDITCTFDFSVVSHSAFTGKYAEIFPQKSVPDIERNIVEKSKSMLKNPWIDSRDFLWDGSSLEQTSEGTVVCLLPERIGEKVRDLSIEVENGKSESIESDYIVPIKLKGNRSREITVHTSIYSGNSIKIVTMTKIDEEVLKKSEKQCEEFLRGVHDAVAGGRIENAIESQYKLMYEEEYRKKPKEKEYPWDKLCRL